MDVSQIQIPKEDRLCWFCPHFEFYSGSPAYSEVTPGCEGSLLCGKGHWDGENIWSNKQFGNAMLMAKTCKDFATDKWVEEEISKQQLVDGLTLIEKGTPTPRKRRGYRPSWLARHRVGSNTS